MNDQIAPPRPDEADVLPSRPLSRGEKFSADLEVVGHLRRGNDLDVYDAWSESRGARCIVKSLRPDRRHLDGPRRALMAEGDLLSRFFHPHIVRAYETIDEPLPAVVMETLGGQTLGRLIDDEGPCDTASLGHLGLQLGSAVRYMHAHGILHLDLKPSNLIAEAGRLRLIDLSLARKPGPMSAGIGTWDYLSPEQARGGEIGPAADVWGIGAVLFEAATGEAPYADDADADREPEMASDGTYSYRDPERFVQLERAPRRADSFAPVERAAADVICACMALEASERPEIDELLRELEALAAVPLEDRRWAHTPMVERNYEPAS